MNAPRRAGRPGDLSGIDPIIATGLEYLGLTSYEIRVYDAIVRNPQSRVPEIARWSKVPQPKVYSTIKRLIERGLCQSHLGAVNQYSALPPTVSFDPLIDEAQDRHAQAMDAISSLKKAFETAGDGMSRREGRVKLYQSRPTAARSFRELMSLAERDVRIVVRFPLVVADYLQEVQRIVAEGGNVQMVVEIVDKPKGRQASFLKEAKEVGAKLRRVDHIPMRMGIFDERIVVMPMSDPAPEQGDGFMMLEVRNPGLAASMCEIYDGYWASGRRM